mmetsp:Transcript_36341/g.71484  ORF Transcript_36341/g.71484 Transcript_36341/m.71484 type:complete len:426 (+) Transcript_36341:173-1450(+)
MKAHSNLAILMRITSPTLIGAAPSRIFRGATLSTTTRFARAQSFFCPNPAFSCGRFLGRRVAATRPLSRHYLLAAPLSQSGDTSALTFLLPPGLTVREIFPIAASTLSVADVTEPRLSVQHLLTNALDLPPNCFSRLPQGEHADAVPSPEQRDKLLSHLSRRVRHEPLQYILGSWDFHTFEVACRSPVLCPRPETEELVEAALRRIPVDAPCRVLDVGCGTGCVGIAVALHRPLAVVVGIDVSDDAVRLSNENAATVLGDGWKERYVSVRCRAKEFWKSDGGGRFSEVVSLLGGVGTVFDVVVSNPPYIPSVDVDGLGPDVLEHEDRVALDGGVTGLDVVEEILSMMPGWTDEVRGGDLLMEVDEAHPRLLERAFSVDGRSGDEGILGDTASLPKKHTDGLMFVERMEDFTGRDRFVWLQRRPMT